VFLAARADGFVDEGNLDITRRELNRARCALSAVRFVDETVGGVIT
jgi:hypothetical protein